MPLQLIVNDAKTLPMQTCSKYETCSVNICPLDPDYKLRSHISGEPSCHFLRLHVKDAATFDEKSTPAYRAAVDAWDHRDELPMGLVKQLQKASQFARKIMPARKAA